MKIPKSSGAVLGGIFVGTLLTVAADIVLQVTGVFTLWDQPPRDDLLLLAAASPTLTGVHAR